MRLRRGLIRSWPDSGGSANGAMLGNSMPIAKILIVNPNTTASMTKTIGAAARAVAAAGTEIVDVTSTMGPVSIEGFYDEAFAVPGLIQALLNAPDADAGIIACFDDTGLDAARSARRFRWSGFARRHW